jgi:glycine dehydrogenase subunit 1
MPMYPFLPHTKEEIKEMLEVIGVTNIDDLYSDVTKIYVRNRIKSTFERSCC